MAIEVILNYPLFTSTIYFMREEFIIILKDIHHNLDLL